MDAGSSVKIKRIILCVPAVLMMLTAGSVSFAENKSTALEKIIAITDQGSILNSAQQQQLLNLAAEFRQNNPPNDELQLMLFHLNKKVSSDLSNLRYLLQDLRAMHALAYTETMKRLKRDDLNLAGKQYEELKRMLEIETLDLNRTENLGSSQDLFGLIDRQLNLLTKRGEKSIFGYWKFWEQKTKPIYKSWQKNYQDVAEKYKEKRQLPYPLTPVLFEERKVVEAFVPLQVLYRRLSEPASADF